jgi:hypothetical protein
MDNQRGLMAKILIVLSIILAGIVVASMHYPMSGGLIACIILLMAGAVVLYHEMGVLDEAKPRSQVPSARAYSNLVARTQTDRSAARASWSCPGVVEQRGDSVK